MSEIALPTEHRSLLRRLRVPLVAFGIPIVIYAMIGIFVRFELFPEAMFPLFMLFQLGLLLALLVVPVWFLFFSGFRPTTKLVGVLVVAALIGTLAAITRRVEFNGSMGPVLVFKWQPDLRAELAERLRATAQAGPANLTAADLAVGPNDFPRYRGVGADGIAPPITGPIDWTANPPKERWRTPVGMSYSGIAVAGKVAITLEQRDKDETVVCYDRDTGKELWAYAYPAEFEQTPPMGGGGPRSTPTIADGDVYSLGARGDLVCLDGTNGKPRWTVNIVTDNGAKVVQWGMTSSPLVVGPLVVVNAGIDPDANRHQAVAAYDRATGKKVWAAGEHPAGYSSPILCTLAGVLQIVLFDGGGVAGIDAADGKELWRHEWKTFNEMNIIQPLILPGDRIFISSELTNGCALVQVKKADAGWTVAPVWANRNMATKFANPVHHAGHIYGLNNGMLCCLDAGTGRRMWKGERFGSGQMLLSGTTLLVQTESSGEVVAVAADPAAYRELGRIPVFRGSRTWNTPALAGGRLYLRNHEEMVGLDLNP